MPRFLLLRHGESTWNAVGRWQGWADPPLSPTGEQQAIDAAEHLLDAGLTAVASSDLERARRTAELVGAALGLGAVDVEPLLKERDVGEFSGLTGPEVQERFPGYNTRRHDPPGGESIAAFLGRIRRGMHGLAQRHRDDVLLVVTHGGVIRRLDDSLGATVPPVTPNLSGRWYEVDADTGDVVPGDLVVPLDPDLVTTPPPT